MNQTDIRNQVLLKLYKAFFLSFDFYSLKDLDAEEGWDKTLFLNVLDRLSKEGFITGRSGWHYIITGLGVVHAEEIGVVPQELLIANRNARALILNVLANVYEEKGSLYSASLKDIAKQTGLDEIALKSNRQVLMVLNYMESAGNAQFKITYRGLDTVKERLESIERGKVDGPHTATIDLHLHRLMLLFIAADGSRQKGLILTEVFKNENMSEADAWREADYMAGEGWIKKLSANGPPYVRLTHEGIKKAQGISIFGEGEKFVSTTIHSADLYMNASPKTDIHLPPEIQESLRAFKADHPTSRKVAFVMMRFGDTSAHANIMAGIQMALDPLGIIAVRADGKEYHDDLFPNVLTYAYGCGFGIAVFERIETEEFNPNVALEVGYMLALKKPVCLLKDRTLKTLHADLVGKLYRVFDPLSPVQTIPTELTRWLSDKGLT